MSIMIIPVIAETLWNKHKTAILRFKNYNFLISLSITYKIYIINLLIIQIFLKKKSIFNSFL